MVVGSYTLNFIGESRTIHIGSGWTNTVVSNNVHVKDLVAVYQVNRVLLLKAIFESDVPIRAPSPEVVSDVALVVDGPDDDGGKGKGEGLGSGPLFTLSSSCWVIGWNC
ncbi:unnamed protein product [Lactuca virosa]|uniref:Uncharacterized protein n=1 Tax=Lactuca virosa TaxID=75947 RepID=A0AAU9P457_9ASTR|nr:unnamed protein product [Lactuca virosa]